MTIETHLKKMRWRDRLSAEEEQAIRWSVGEVVTEPTDKVVVRAGEELKQSMILLDGWMARVKDLPNGQRQITELHVSGDYTDLHAFALKRLDHDVVTLTRCRIALVPHERLREITERLPHLTRVYWAATNIDASIQREWTMSLGRRSATERMAHLFCELDVRLGIVGLVDNGRYDFPLTQAELSECLGLTPVHVNRTLQDLRSKKVIEVGDRQVRILDLKALRSIAQFDDDYLYLEKRDR